MLTHYHSRNTVLRPASRNPRGAGQGRSLRAAYTAALLAARPNLGAPHVAAQLRRMLAVAYRRHLAGAPLGWPA